MFDFLQPRLAGILSVKSHGGYSDPTSAIVAVDDAEAVVCFEATAQGAASFDRALGREDGALVARSTRFV